VKLQEFLDEYFALIKKVNNFHWNFLIENKFVFPKTNYMDLKKFIDTSTNFLRDIDDKILKGLAGKLYQDIDSLYQFYIQFTKETQYIEVIFYRNYLDSLDEYREVKEKVEKLKGKIEEYTDLISKSEEDLKYMTEKDNLYKKTKKIYVDSIYELSKCKDKFYENKGKMEEIKKREEVEFFPEFKKLREIHLKKLEKIINVKLFYFEKLLWFNAQNSELIVKFFTTSHIEGDLSTKTFIKYFLKNIDESKSIHSDWINYLKQILKVIE